MGLRVNNNITALRALLNLNRTDREQASALEKLSTGLRILRASDDPSGLVISENLRAQVVALKRAAQNTQNGANLLSIADSALGEISDILRGIKDSVIFALNSGGITPEQLQAQQDTVDNSINAIDRISKTTRFADRELLNGSSGFIISNQSQQINDLLAKQAVFSAGQTDLSMNFRPVSSARRAEFRASGFTAPGAGTAVDITVTGPKGSAPIRITGGNAAGPAADTMQTFLDKIQRANSYLPAAMRGHSSGFSNSLDVGDSVDLGINITGPSGTANITVTVTDTTTASSFFTALATEINNTTTTTGVKAATGTVNGLDVIDIYTTATGSDKSATLTLSSVTVTAGDITGDAFDVNFADFVRYGPEIDTSGAYVNTTVTFLSAGDTISANGFNPATGINGFVSSGNNIIATEDVGADIGIYFQGAQGAAAGSVNLTPVNADGTLGTPDTFNFRAATADTAGISGSNGQGNPLRAAINITQSTALASDVTINVTGPRGSAEVVLPAGSTNAEIAEAINRFATTTGAFAIKTGINTTNGSEVFKLLSEDFGSKQNVQVKVVVGTFTLDGVSKTVGESATANGTDAQLKLAALTFTAAGRNFTIATPFFTGTFSISPDVAISHSDLPSNFDAGLVDTNANISISGSFTLPSRAMLPIAANPIPGGSVTPLNLTIKNSGLTFQIGTKALSTDSITISIPDVGAGQLGSEAIQDPLTFVVNGISSTKMITDVNSTNTDTILDVALKGGLLTTLQSGKSNDLDSNPQNASIIVDQAINSVNRTRGFLGAIISQNLETAKDSLDVSIQNVAATESAIRDLNFAEETANFTRTQILFQSGIAVLASANLIPQSVLALLR